MKPVSLESRLENVRRQEIRDELRRTGAERSLLAAERVRLAEKLRALGVDPDTLKIETGGTDPGN